MGRRQQQPEFISAPPELLQFLSYCEDKYGMRSRELMRLDQQGDVWGVRRRDNAEMDYWRLWLWHMDATLTKIRLPINFSLEAGARDWWVRHGDLERPHIKLFFKPDYLYADLIERQGKSVKEAARIVAENQRQAQRHREAWEHYYAL